MEFGLQLSNLELEKFRDVAQAAEGLGYDVLLVPDHIVHERPGGQYDPHTLAWDPLLVTAVMADATKRIQIGHLVLCNLFRHPVMTAQSLASLDHLSGGRAVAGLGSGWTETEFRMTGIPFPDVASRLRMLDESLQCMRSLWTKEETTFSGEFYRFEKAILWPKPTRPLPILLGGSGRGLLRVAAKHADVVNIISETGRAGMIRPDSIGKLTDDAYRAKVSFVRDEAKKLGRDPAKIRVSSVIFTLILTESRAHTEKMAGKMAAAFGGSSEAALRSPLALIGTEEECIAELGRRAKEWQISQFVFGRESYQVMRRLRERVLVHV